MKRFIQGEHRGQSTLLPESLDDYVSDTNPVRVVDVFVDELDLAKLGFDGVIPNSLDAVGDRDFILDFLFGSSMIMTHMSRFAEDLILYSSTEFGFVKLADAYSTVGAVMFTLVLN